MKASLLVSLLLGNTLCIYLCTYLNNIPDTESCCSATTGTSEENALPDDSCDCSMERQFHNDTAGLNLNIFLITVDIFSMDISQTGFDSNTVFTAVPAHKGYSPPLYLLTHSFLT